MKNLKIIPQIIIKVKELKRMIILLLKIANNVNVIQAKLIDVLIVINFFVDFAQMHIEMNKLIIKSAIFYNFMIKLLESLIKD